MPELNDHYQMLAERELAMRHMQANYAPGTSKYQAYQSKLQEVSGERIAADWMKGDYHASGGPAPGTCRMLSGYARSGGGIDQIWVRPANWTVHSPSPPDEIFIVEAKGGDATVTTELAYAGEKGRNQQPMPYGAPEMSANWVYVHVSSLQTMAKDSPDLMEASALATKFLNGTGMGMPPPAVTGVVVRENAFRGGAAPSITNYTQYVAPPPPAVKTSTRGRIVTKKSKFKFKGPPPKKEKIDKLLTSQKVGNIQLKCQQLDTFPVVGAPPPGSTVLERHDYNLQQRKKTLASKAEALAYSSFDPNKTAKQRKRIREQIEEVAKSLQEVQGERGASTAMASILEQDPHQPIGTMRAKYRMIEGFTAPDKGFDQVWITPPDWFPGMAPPPPGSQIVVVEAKGGGSQVSTASVYKGELTSDSSRTRDGTSQMEHDWVYVNARRMKDCPQLSVESHAIGDLMESRLRTLPNVPIAPPPDIRGVVLNTPGGANSTQTAVPARFMQNYPVITADGIDHIHYN